MKMKFDKGSTIAVAVYISLFVLAVFLSANFLPEGIETTPKEQPREFERHPDSYYEMMDDAWIDYLIDKDEGGFDWR